MALVIIGYLVIWGVFGLAAHLADLAVLSVVRQSDWLIANGWVIGAAVLATAGLYQFSALKSAVSTSAGRRSGLSSNIGAGPARNGSLFCWAADMARFASAAAGA